jgi:Ceramidase
MSLYSAKPVEITIPENCPWHHGQAYYGTPNVDWCEPTVCSWINEPANTWSNLPFLLVGLWMWKRFTNPLVRSFGVVVFIMGCLSGFYHATNNLLTQYFDFFGMALMTSFMLAFVYRRFLKVAQTAFDKYFWFFMSCNLTILIFLGALKLPVQMMLLLNTIPILFAELYLFFVLKRTRKFHWFVLSFSVLVIAQVFAQIDLKRIYCEPTNIFVHGHVAWHILCAVAMGLAGMHMKENS